MRNSDWDIRGPDVPAVMFPAQRVKFSLGVPQGEEARKRRDLLTDHLRRNQEWTVIRALRDGTVSVHDVVRRLRQTGALAIPELRADVESLRAGEVPTVAEEVIRYLEHYAQVREEWSIRNTRSRLSRASEQMVALEDGEARLDSLRLDQVTRTQIREAVRAVSINPSTQGNILSALSGLFTWSIEEEAESARVAKRLPRWSVNPVSKIERPAPQSRVVVASDAQVHALIAAGQLYQQAYLRAFVQIGLRAGELTHTRYHTDFDPERWSWKIQGRAKDPRCPCPQCKGGGWTPKSENGARAFRIPADQVELRGTLAAWLEVNTFEPGDFLFARSRGRPWTNRTLGADFEALCEKAGVRYGLAVPGGLTLHALRHTCITNFVRKGIREAVIADLVGDTIQTIYSNYVHLDENDLADALSRGPSYG